MNEASGEPISFSVGRIGAADSAAKLHVSSRSGSAVNAAEVKGEAMSGELLAECTHENNVRRWGIQGNSEPQLVECCRGT